MNFELAADQAFFRETTRKFLDASMPTTAVRSLHHVDDGFERTWWRKGAELGWTSLLVDPEHGGGSLSDNGLADLAIVAEEFGRHVAPGPLVACNVVAAAISAFGDDSLRSRWLPSLLDGSVIGTWAHGGAAAMQVSRSGASTTLTGTVDIAEAAAQAEVLLVTADAGLYVVDVSHSGCTVTRRGGLDLVRRFGRVVLRDAMATPLRADADDVAWLERIVTVLQCAEMAGATARVFEFSLQYVFDRYSFGRPLASYQALKHRFADMKMQLEACHAVTDVATRSVGAGARGEDRLRADRAVSSAKAYVATRAPEVIHDCVQMHGGIGVTWEHDIHLFLRRVTVDAGLFGTADDHRERVGAIAAQQQLGATKRAVA